jgi:hypothetical protein
MSVAPTTRCRWLTPKETAATASTSVGGVIEYRYVACECAVGFRGNGTHCVAASTTTTTSTSTSTTILNGTSSTAGDGGGDSDNSDSDGDSGDGAAGGSSLALDLPPVQKCFDSRAGAAAYYADSSGSDSKLYSLAGSVGWNAATFWGERVVGEALCRCQAPGISCSRRSMFLHRYRIWVALLTVSIIRKRTRTC